MPGILTVRAAALLTSLICFFAPAHAEEKTRDCSSLVTSGGASQSLDSIFPFTTYLKDTLHSLEAMRGENALLADTIWIRSPEALEILNPDTSPTNIAVDLLIQAELGETEKIQRVLETLEKLHFHGPTGLFFSRYSADRHSLAEDLNVSSIDNMHLALALFTIQENFRGRRQGEIAARLFERMNFSVYYDAGTGLIGGNLRPRSDGQWTREEYNFAHFGSEARLLYSAGWALGLFRDHVDQPGFLEKAFASLAVELYSAREGDILKLWDGSAFQLFFPMIFIGEEMYSARMRKIFEVTGSFMIEEGRRRELQFPAAHSAGRAAICESTDEPCYKDKAGNRALTSAGNLDLNDPRMSETWDTTFAPYALFMAATLNPQKFAGIFLEAQRAAWRGDRLYVDRMGWMDGIHVAGPRKGQVVPAQLSLNQGMIALSLLRMRAADAMNLSSRTLFENKEIRERLQRFYKLFDQRL